MAGCLEGFLLSLTLLHTLYAPLDTSRSALQLQLLFQSGFLQLFFYHMTEIPRYRFNITYERLDSSLGASGIKQTRMGSRVSSSLF